MAAAPSTLLTPTASSWVVTMPVCASTALARLEASNSTGKVTNWNTTVAANSRMPMSTNMGLEKIWPPMNTQIQACEPNMVTGTILERKPNQA